MLTPTEYIKLILRNEELFKSKAADTLNDYTDKRNTSKYVIAYRFFWNSLIGFIDFFSLLLILIIRRLLRKRKVKLFFINKSFCLYNKNKYSLRLGENFITSSTILINTSKELHVKKIGSNKVYNLGFVVKALSVLYYFERDNISKIFKSYSIVNSFLLSLNSSIDEIYFFFYYDLNSFSLIFSRFRNKLKLIEIQHGSMINFPPYTEPSPIKVADIFYVRNVATIQYLKSHLCRNFICEYRLLEYPKVNKVNKSGLNILYASTIEFKGFHPVFKQFIRSLNPAESEKINLAIRLHPRERDQEYLFLDDIKGVQINYCFDNSENWLMSNAVKDLIVVSPWSSIIEEAFDNDFTTLIVDEVGRMRFKDLIDNSTCFFTTDIVETLDQIKKNVEPKKG